MHFDNSFLGIGGTHYPEKFNKLIIESDYAFGPIIPKHGLGFLDAKLLSQILAKSTQKVEGAVVDWKGLGDQKRRVVKLLEDFGLEIIKV